MRKIKGNEYIQIDGKLVMLKANNSSRVALVDNHIPLLEELKKHTWYVDSKSRSKPYFRNSNKMYLHSFIYEYFYKKKPKNHIDHLDNYTLNNKILNLHDIPKELNSKNRAIYNNVDFKLDIGQYLGLYWIIADDDNNKFSIATTNFDDFIKHKKLLYKHEIKGYKALAEKEQKLLFVFNLINFFNTSNGELTDAEIEVQKVIKQIFKA